MKNIEMGIFSHNTALYFYDFFIGSDGKILGSSYVSKQINELAELAGIEKNKVSIYTIRDLFIQNESQRLKEEQAVELEEENEEEII